MNLGEEESLSLLSTARFAVSNLTTVKHSPTIIDTPNFQDQQRKSILAETKVKPLPSGGQLSRNIKKNNFNPCLPISLKHKKPILLADNPIRQK